VLVAGAGMAGLVAAARARELGADVRLIERASAPGGSMLLSSGVVWRYRDWETFRAQCPGGNEELQRLVFDRLDDALEWLRALGAEPLWTETGNPLTVGMRFETRRLTETFTRAAGQVLTSRDVDVHLHHDHEPPEPLVLCTGGFHASAELVREHVAPAADLPLRANRWSAGAGLRIGLERGAGLSAGMDEFYGRNMPDAPFGEDEFVSLSQLYARWARIVDAEGHELALDPEDWSETRLVQATAHRPGAVAWYLLDRHALSRPTRYGTVREAVEAAPTRSAPADLPFDPPEGTVVAVRVKAAITTTLGGLRVDTQARVLRADGRPVDRLYAAGADVGGISTGGWASGLASALVLGLVAAESAAARDVA
jgi:succinate dehydrogenase/fumarate reductase flavoprotein subunit